MHVTVAFSPAPREVDLVELDLPEGTRLIDAVRASGLFDRHPQLQGAAQRFGVWGANRPPEQLLRDGDRVEAWRPLQVDPMQARRLRHKQNAAPKR